MLHEKIDTTIKKLEEAIAAIDDIKLPSGPGARAVAVTRTNAETALLWAQHVKKTTTAPF